VALGPVRIGGHEIEARYVQETSPSERSHAPIASNPDAYRRERGQSWHGRRESGRRGNAQLSSALPWPSQVGQSGMALWP
jgi:hypothetical protein